MVRRHLQSNTPTVITYDIGLLCNYKICWTSRLPSLGTNLLGKFDILRVTNETSSSLAPDFAGVTVHSPSPVLRRGTVCRLTFELHQHCLLLKIGLILICFCSHIMSHLNQLNSSGVCCTAPL